jgi:hypothetical protein
VVAATFLATVRARGRHLTVTVHAAAAGDGDDRTVGDATTAAVDGDERPAITIVDRTAALTVRHVVDRHMDLAGSVFAEDLRLHWRCPWCASRWQTLSGDACACLCCGAGLHDELLGADGAVVPLRVATRPRGSA